MTLVLAAGVIYGSYQLWGENGAWICVGVILFGGYWVLLVLAFFISGFFLKSGDSSTIWNFDEIPEIRKFLNQKLPHTRN